MLKEKWTNEKTEGLWKSDSIYDETAYQSSLVPLLEKTFLIVV